jgi:hypothetical protein
VGDEYFHHLSQQALMLLLTLDLQGHLR